MLNTTEDTSLYPLLSPNNSFCDIKTFTAGLRFNFCFTNVDWWFLSSFCFLLIWFLIKLPECWIALQRISIHQRIVDIHINLHFFILWSCFLSRSTLKIVPYIYVTPIVSSVNRWQQMHRNLCVFSRLAARKWITTQIFKGYKSYSSIFSLHCLNWIHLSIKHTTADNRFYKEIVSHIIAIKKSE